jgi:hypothetical protein
MVIVSNNDNEADEAAAAPGPGPDWPTPVSMIESALAGRLTPSLRASFRLRWPATAGQDGETRREVPTRRGAPIYRCAKTAKTLRQIWAAGRTRRSRRYFFGQCPLPPCRQSRLCLPLRRGRQSFGKVWEGSAAGSTGSQCARATGQCAPFRTLGRLTPFGGARDLAARESVGALRSARPWSLSSMKCPLPSAGGPEFPTQFHPYFFGRAGGPCQCGMRAWDCL